MEKKMLKFELTIEETNTILASLGKQPFDAVANLITKIRQQAAPQIPALTAAREVEKAED
jgi:hypothetical protein